MKTLFFLIALPGLAWSQACPFENGVRDPIVSSVSEVGALSAPPSVTARDGGESVMHGDHILWTFGDNLFNPKSVDGTNLRTNTAALANPSDPVTLSEPTDANGAPFQAIPFTEAEQAYNDSTNAPNDRVAIWLGGLIPEGNGSRAFFSTLFVRGANLDYEHIGIGTAWFEHGSTTATRGPDLFTADEPGFTRPLVHEGYLYLYGNIPDDSFLPFGVARVPLDQIEDRTAYRFWDGALWSDNIGATASIFGWIPGAVTISWNEYLGQFLAIHAEPFSNDVMVRTAPRPEGPWTDAEILFTRDGGPNGQNNYAGIEHPQLAEDCGKTIYVTYYRPGEIFFGQLHLVRVTLDAPVRASRAPELPPAVESATVFPNPADQVVSAWIRLVEPVLRLEVELMDSVGRLVRREVAADLDGGEHRFDFDSADLAGGAYRLRIRIGDVEFSRGLVLVR